MITGQYFFKEVSLLVTHYNRSLSLERLLHAFSDLNCLFEDIIVSDDGSKPVHIERLQALQKLYPFRLITTDKNKGLGNNINKGQDAVKTLYTLYVQEDFEPTAAFPEHFADACSIFEKRKDLDIIKFYAYFPYPYTKPYGKGFSEMVFHASPWYMNHLKFYFYSDHPHLRHSNFFKKFGRYREGESGDVTEYRMSLSFIHHKARGLFYDDFTGLFYQKNSPDEPSTMGRADWRQRKKPLILLLRFFYLRIKFLRWSWDVWFGK
jgi:glycosyltransferase involved in cell wall biosynthesis